MSLVAVGHIITKKGIIAIQGSPEVLAAAGRQIGDEVLAGVAQTGDEAMAALELADLAKSSIQAAKASDPSLESIKVIASASAGTAVGLAVTPFLTPLGGAIAGFVTGKIYDYIFDRAMELEPEPYSDGPWTPLILSPEEIPTEVNQHWQSATTPPRRDPLAIDLDGDGIETIGTNGHVVQFDHDGDGTRTGTGWLAPDDAWLVLDRNGNGQVDSGVELFGVDTPLGAPGATTATDGFHALRALDSNADGVFNALDAAFGQVQVWQDANQDGLSESGELASLYAKGITQVALQPSASTTDLGNGNTLTGTAQVVRADGTLTDAGAVHLLAGNLNLADNPFYREFPDPIATTVAAEALPDMRGSGWVRDLREAMSTGTPAGNALAAAVSTMAAATTRDQQLAAVDTVLRAWAESSGRLTPAQDLRPLSATVVSQSSSATTRRYTIAEPGQWAAGHAQFEFPSDAYSTVLPGFGGHTSRALTGAGAEVLRRMVLLEAFNGSRFVDVTRLEGPPPGFSSSPPDAPAAGMPATDTPGSEEAALPVAEHGYEAVAGTLPGFGSGSSSTLPGFGSGSSSTLPGFGSGGSSTLPGFGSGGPDPGTTPSPDPAAPWTDPLPRVSVPLTQAQIDFIGQAYDALRDSVHAAVAVQTRLKPYTDQIQLRVDGDAVSLDFSAMQAAFHTRAASDPYNAVADLLDLQRFEGATLSQLGWQADAARTALLAGIAITPQIQALLDADAAAATAPDAADAAIAANPKFDAIDDPAIAANPKFDAIDANPKFDTALPHNLELFGDVAPTPAGDAAPMPPSNSVDLLIQAMAALPPAAADGYVNPPSNDRTWSMPSIAVVA